LLTQDGKATVHDLLADRRLPEPAQSAKIYNVQCFYKGARRQKGKF
jgi:hypothetical protein